MKIRDAQFPLVRRTHRPDAQSDARNLTSRYGLVVEFDMHGVEWEYINALHSAYKFHENWPEGMLCHVTGPTEQGIASLGVWTNREAEAKYFGETAIHVISDFLREGGVTQGETGATDYEPDQRVVHRLTLGPQVDAFVDIGEDADATAISCLGTAPFAANISIAGMSLESYDCAIHALGYSNNMPAESIMHVAQILGDNLLEFQVWSSRTAAELEFDESLRPALLEAASAAGEDVEIEVTFTPLFRISFGSAGLATGLDT